MRIAAISIGDVVVPALEPALGLPAVIAAFLAVIVLEAALLKLLRWDPSWLRCFVHAGIINVVTTLVGLVVSFAGIRPLLNFNVDGASIFTAFGMPILATWLIEALLLKLLKRDGEKPLVKSLILNIASYLMLFAFTLLSTN